MTVTQQERRIQALYDDSNVSRRNLCERTVHLEADMEDVAALCRDAMAEASRAARGFSVHPKRYRDLYSRAKKLGVYDDE